MNQKYIKSNFLTIRQATRIVEMIRETNHLDYEVNIKTTPEGEAEAIITFTEN